MAKQPKPKATSTKDGAKAQSERFIQTARELGADESGEKFNELVSRVIPAVRKPEG